MCIQYLDSRAVTLVVIVWDSCTEVLTAPPFKVPLLNVVKIQ